MRLNWERHPIGVGELQVGNAIGDLGGAPRGLGEPHTIKLGKSIEARAAVRGDLVGRTIATEELPSRIRRPE